MKTTEHPTDETQEELNDVGDVLQQIAPYWRVIVGVAVLAATVIGLLAFISSNKKAAEETAWATYFAAVDIGSPLARKELADNSTGAVVPWAHQAAAQSRLIDGMQKLFSDREQARSELEEAVSGFESAVASSENNDLLNQRSLWGLGQANEGLNELEKAKTAYQQLLDRWPESALARRAQTRITSLNEPETQDFYRWFFEQKPKPPTTSAFETNPAETFSIPDAPDVSIPSLPGASHDDSPGPVSTDLDDIVEPGNGETATEETSAPSQEEGSSETSSEDASALEAPSTSDSEATEPNTEGSSDPASGEESVEETETASGESVSEDVTEEAVEDVTPPADVLDDP